MKSFIEILKINKIFIIDGANRWSKVCNSPFNEITFDDNFILSCYKKKKIKTLKYYSDVLLLNDNMDKYNVEEH
jgi:hypothetical protein